MLLPTLAHKIIQEVHKLIHEELIMTDTTGTIIASTDPNRIGTFHEGSLIAMRTRQNLHITSELEKTLQGVKAGINLPIFFQNKVIGVIGITGKPSEIGHYGELLKRMTELFIQESYYNEQLEWQYRAQEAFVFDWLSEREFSTDFQNRASILEIDLNLRRQVVMAHIHSPDTSIRKLWNYLSHETSIQHPDLYVRWGQDRFLLLLKEQSKNKLLRRLTILKKQIETDFDVKLSLGVGTLVQPEQLRKSFDEAARALQVSKRTNTITFDDDLTLEMLLQDIHDETKTEYIKRTIGALGDDHELIETLSMFIQENQSLKETAERLHIHVNTLHYRFKKIEDMINLNPRNIDDLMILYLGLLLLEQHPKKQE